WVEVEIDEGKPGGDGAAVVLVAVQLSVPGLSLPPVFKGLGPINPPQTTISVPVQTAVCSYRPAGTLVVLVAVQLSIVGLYRPPVFKYTRTYPPHTIISLPAHTTEHPCRPTRASVVLVAVQLSVPGLYLP